MYSEEYSDKQDPYVADNAYSADFIAQYEKNNMVYRTGSDVFCGCCMETTDLAVVYGNIRTFKILVEMHQAKLFQCDQIEECLKQPHLMAYLEEQCVSNSSNHLSNRYTNEVLARSADEFQYYMDMPPFINA